MQFTYQCYSNLISLLKYRGYSICSYHDWMEKDKCVILRHDIDNDIEKALMIAKIENDLGVTSTYFVLVTSDFYNVFSAKSHKLLQSISDCGHAIGLHFDEVRYTDIETPEDIKRYILDEVNLLSTAIGRPVETVSMHRPSKMILEAELNIPGIVNSYGKTFFREFKYLSDSRRRWREPVEEIIESKVYDRLHILTHPIWYNNKEIDIHDTIFQFVNAGNKNRYTAEKENITDLDSIMREDEVK